MHKYSLGQSRSRGSVNGFTAVSDSVVACCCFLRGRKFLVLSSEPPSLSDGMSKCGDREHGLFAEGVSCLLSRNSSCERGAGDAGVGRTE